MKYNYHRVTMPLSPCDKNMLDEICLLASQKAGKTLPTTQVFRTMLWYCYERKDEIEFEEK